MIVQRVVVCLSLSLSLSVCLSVCLAAYLSTNQTIHLFICLFDHHHESPLHQGRGALKLHNTWIIYHTATTSLSIHPFIFSYLACLGSGGKKSLTTPKFGGWSLKAWPCLRGEPGYYTYIYLCIIYGYIHCVHQTTFKWLVCCSRSNTVQWWPL